SSAQAASPEKARTTPLPTCLTQAGLCWRPDSGRSARDALKKWGSRCQWLCSLNLGCICSLRAPVSHHENQTEDQKHLCGHFNRQILVETKIRQWSEFPIAVSEPTNKRYPAQ